MEGLLEGSFDFIGFEGYRAWGLRFTGTVEVVGFYSPTLADKGLHLRF